MRGPIVHLLSLLICLCVLRCVAADEEAELVGHDESVIWLEFSPDGTLLASASRDKTASVWRIVDGTRLATFTHTEQVCRVAFSPDSRLLASVAFDAKVRLWQITPPRPLATLEPHRLIPDALTFSPDGRRLLSGSPGEAKVWDVEKQRLTHGFARTRLCLAGSPLKFFPDGKELVSGVYSEEQIEEHNYSAQAVRAWNFDSREVADLFRPLFRGARDIAISRDGKKLVIVGESRGPRVIDVTTGTSRELLQGLAHLTRVELVHDDRIILANGKGIAAWDLDSGVYLGPVGAGIVKGSFAISPDGAKISYSANSRDIRVAPLERIVPRDLKARIARGEAPDYSLIRDGSVKQLEGTWEPKRLRAKPLAKDDHGMQVIFKDGRMTVDGPDGEKVHAYILDTTAQPTRIDTREVTVTSWQLGIYRLEGDTLTLCVADSRHARPMNFDVAQRHCELLVLERVKVAPRR
jgi:uncharacterized protein (TIGR03067 family)